MNAGIGFAGAGAVIKAASNDPGKSEEIILDALSGILLGPQSVRLADSPNDISAGLDIWVNAGDFSKRTTIHERIIALEQKIDATPGLSLEPFADASGATLAGYELYSLAKSNIAYRHALVHGNAFAVVGADYSAHAAELSLYDPATEQRLSKCCAGAVNDELVVKEAA